jgi:hypothetical protein
MKDILTGIGVVALSIVGLILTMAFYGVMIVGSIWLGLTIISWIF